MRRVNTVVDKEEIKRNYPDDYNQTLQKLRDIIFEIEAHENNIKLKESLKEVQFKNKIKVQ